MGRLLVHPQEPAAAGEDVAPILPARVHARPVQASTTTATSSLANLRLVGRPQATHSGPAPSALGRGREGAAGEEEDADFWSKEGGSGSLSSSGDQVVKLEAASRRCCTCATSSDACAWAAS